MLLGLLVLSDILSTFLSEAHVKAEKAYIKFDIPFLCYLLQITNRLIYPILQQNLDCSLQRSVVSEFNLI